MNNSKPKTVASKAGNMPFL